MGHYSERLVMTITAELIFWKLRENGAVQGTIYNSTDPEYNDGEDYIFMNTRLTHYPRAEGFWPDHFIMKIHTDKYFILADREMDRR